MSHQVPYTYPLAPIEVETANGREMSFEVARDGSVSITAEVDDYSGWSGPRTTEAYFFMSAEDWRAVVAHVERDLTSGNDRYEATIKLVIAADGQDIAWRIARAAANAAKVEGVEHAHASILALRYSPELTAESREATRDNADL